MDYHHAIQHAKNCATVAKFEPEGPEYPREYPPLRCDNCGEIVPSLSLVDGMMMCSDCERIEP